jgi:SHS2 domain-containing protein
MERYKFLEHTSDAKFQAFGRTLEEAFSNAGLATAGLMWNWENVEKKVEHQVKVKGNDLKQLLVNFLEEIIYLFETKSFLLGSVEKLTIEKEGKNFRLKALIKGDRHSDKYKIHGDVKAITYNEMEVETKNHFMIQVVVDI